MSPRERIGPEHDVDDDGDHDESECWSCLHNETVTNGCKCGECCRRLLIEVGMRDAEREPRIKERGLPIYEHPALTTSGQRELIGFYLNRPGGGPCVFFDQQANLCQIYATRPLLCRLFDCDGEGREQLIELGIIRREGTNDDQQKEKRQRAKRRL